jgi:hypothetical protein
MDVKRRKLSRQNMYKKTREKGEMKLQKQSWRMKTNTLIHVITRKGGRAEEGWRIERRESSRGKTKLKRTQENERLRDKLTIRKRMGGNLKETMWK